MEISRLLEQFKSRESQIMNQDTFKRFGILIPLVKVGSETHLLFEVRSKNLRSQPGDICFPGGKMDADDESLMSCAIRETSEELGIREDQVDHVIPLDYIISGAGLIHPFAGRLQNAASLKLNEAEVAEVFTVPISFFINNEPQAHKISLKVEPERDFPFELIQNGKSYDWRKRETKELFYVYHDRVIWGLTARIIHHFVQLLKS